MDRNDWNNAKPNGGFYLWVNGLLLCYFFFKQMWMRSGMGL